MLQQLSVNDIDLFDHQRSRPVHDHARHGLARPPLPRRHRHGQCSTASTSTSRFILQCGGDHPPRGHRWSFEIDIDPSTKPTTRERFHGACCDVDMREPREHTVGVFFPPPVGRSSSENSPESSRYDRPASVRAFLRSHVRLAHPRTGRSILAEHPNKCHRFHARRDETLAACASVLRHVCAERSARGRQKFQPVGRRGDYATPGRQQHRRIRGCRAWQGLAPRLSMSPTHPAHPTLV